LENDESKVMVLGALWLPIEETRDVSEKIREIKKKHKINPHAEIKWVKVSPSKEEMYYDLIKLFFSKRNMHFRCIVIPDKSLLDYEYFHHSHNIFYYKMYFNLLKTIWNKENKYRVYIDIKDTLGGEKIIKLHKVLCNDLYDFSREIIERIQLVRSHEVEILQLTDLLIGAIAYENRGLSTSKTKKDIINFIKEKTKYTLKKSTFLSEKKFNIFVWRSKGIDNEF
jgi:hypothetical protein